MDFKNIDEIKIYKEVLNGIRKKFPMGFWQQEDSKKWAINIFKYATEEVMKIDRNHLLSITGETMRKYKLEGLFMKLYKGDLNTLILDSYPDVKISNGYSIVKSSNHKPPEGLMEKLILENLCSEGYISRSELNKALRIIDMKIKKSGEL